MFFRQEKDLKIDLSVPGITVLVGKESELKYLGLSGKKDSDIILIPQPSSDPNDPLNWPTWRKQLQFWILFFFALILAAISGFTGPIYSLLSEVYGVSINKLNIGSGLVYLFLAFSCLFCQPFAEKFGRRPVYIVSTLLTIVSSIVFVKPDSYSGFIGRCIVIGCAVGPIDSLIEVSITDIFFLHQHGKYIGIYTFTLGVGSSFGPFLAGYITENINYLWCGYISIIIAGALLVFEIFFLEESVYERRDESAKLSDKLLSVAISNTSNNNLNLSSEYENIEIKNAINTIIESDQVETEYSEDVSSPPELKTYAQRLRPYLITNTPFSIINIFKMLKVLRYPAVFWCSIAYGMQICWLSLITVSEAEFFMAPPYNFSSDSLGLLDLAMVIGAITGGTYAACSDMFQLYLTRKNDGIFEPEFRLLMLPIPIFLNAVGIFMYGLGPYYGVHWIVGAIGIVLITNGLSAITSLSLNYVLDCYPNQAAQTMTSVLFVRNLMGMVFTFVFQYWLDGVGVIGTTSMLAAFCIVINGSFVIIYIWGKKFRIYTSKWYLET